MEISLENDVLGNVRSGTRGEKNNPIKLPYFDVHVDPSTSELAVEIFNSVYNKPAELKIRFVSQNPMVVSLQRYEGKILRCYGNNKEAKLLDEKGKRKQIECNSQTCRYKAERKCKLVGRLYFVIDKLEDEGIWCYPIGSEEGIKNIWRRIKRANRLNEDLTKDWYKMYLYPKEAAIGKNYIPDIKKIGELNLKSNIDDKQEKNIVSSSKPKESNTNNANYLMIKNFTMTMFNNKKVPKIHFIDTNKNEKSLILLPEGNQEILKLKSGSIIQVISVSKRDNVEILNNFKIIKDISETKKAV